MSFVNKFYKNLILESNKIVARHAKKFGDIV